MAELRFSSHHDRDPLAVFSKVLGRIIDIDDVHNGLEFVADGFQGRKKLVAEMAHIAAEDNKPCFPPTCHRHS